MAKYNRRNSVGYGLTTPLPTLYNRPVEAQRTPAVADTGYDIGQVWIDRSTNQAWIMTNPGVWALSSPGASDVDTINGLSPVAGNIIIVGGLNLTDVNGGNTVTINLDPAITLGTSVTSPLYTAAAGVDVLVSAPAGQDIILRLGDAAGANFLRVQSSTPADVFTVDSTGVLTFAGLTVTGAFTQTGGVANIGTDAAANNINIGTGAAAKTITLGNSTGATSLVFNCGTGPLNIGTNAIAHTITIGNVTGATAVNVNSGTGACAWTTTNGNFSLITGTGAINVGTDAAAKTITIGNNTGATAVNVTAGSGGSVWTVQNGTFDLNTGTGNITIGADAAAKALFIGNATGATSVQIDAGTGGLTMNTVNSAFNLTTGTGAINVGTDAFAHTVTIGNITGATAVNVNSGTGACAWTTTNGVFSLITGTGAINLGADAAAKTVTIGNITGASSVVVDVGTGNADFGVSATAHTTRVGSTTGASATTVQCGTGAMTLNGGGIFDIDAVGQLQINSSGSTIDIGNDAVAQNINVGTGAAARTITIGNATGATSVVVNGGTGAMQFGANAIAHTTTIGSTTGASATVIQAGTGEITVTGVVKEITAEFLSQNGINIPAINCNAIVNSALNTGVAATGATGDVNNVILQTGVHMQEFVIGAGQTILQPIMGANGLIISGDQTLAEGYEYNFNANLANAFGAYTIGTSPAFFMELGLYINDMDGAAPYVFGFRKTEANNATFGNYTDYATIGMIAASSVTNIVTATELNSGGQTVTDTTDAWGGDGSFHVLGVFVDAAGNVTYEIDGVAPSAFAAFQFDNADVVHPFIRITHAATPTTVAIRSIKIGFQP